jgi:hypothetical protein
MTGFQCKGNKSWTPENGDDHQFQECVRSNFVDELSVVAHDMQTTLDRMKSLAVP